MAVKIENIGVGIVFALCIASTANAQSVVNCTATGAGRYPNPGDITCKTYTLCVATSAGAVAYNYTCPSTAVFNPNTSLCTAPENYKCTVTTPSVCTSEGLIPDPNVTDCSSYIECVIIDGAYIETKFMCPANTYYNPSTTDCDFSYVCPSKVAQFNCTAKGRYPNKSDLTCKTYYMCARTITGSWVRYTYTCPGSSVFSPFSRFCTTSYTCPINRT